MNPTFEEILQKASDGRLEWLRRAAGRGVDLGVVDPEYGALFEHIVNDLCAERRSYRYDVVRLMLELGADPNADREHGDTPLIPAMLTMDTEMLRILLDAGADPNLPGGFTDDESFYDWAVDDYYYQMIIERSLNEACRREEMIDGESWVQFLDRFGRKHGVRGPDCVVLLREYGAKSAAEMEAESAGQDASVSPP